MKVTLLEVPYFLGQENVGMGRGPGHVIEGGAADTLTALGHEVNVVPVRRLEPFKDELSAIADVNGQLASGIISAVSDGAFPITVSGNCNSCLGTLAASADHTRTGIIWLDAHGDINTPETSQSGFFDGMALAIAAGLCFEDFWGEFADNTPFGGRNILHLGSRDLDPGEPDLFASAGVTVLSADALQQSGVVEALRGALAALQSQVDNIYLHFDVDVLNPDESPGNEYGARTPGGLSVAEVEQIIRLVAETMPIKAAAMTSYNPEFDPEDKTLRAGLHMLTVIADAAAQRA
jgi:arginase